MKKNLVAIVLLLIASNPVWSQKSPVAGTDLTDHFRWVERAFTTKAGLGGYTTRSMFQDELGFVWLETSKQLQRFDGIHFSSVARSSKGADPVDVLSHLYEAPGPWILQIKYRAGALRNNASIDTLVDPVGDDWSVLEARFINSLTLETLEWDSFWKDSPPPFSLDEVCQLYKDKKNEVYRITLKNGALFRFDDRWEQVLPPAPGKKILHLAFSHQGWYLLVSARRLSIRDENERELWSMPLTQPLENHRVLARGGKWYASSLLHELFHPLVLPELAPGNSEREDARLKQHFHYLSTPADSRVWSFRSPDNSVLTIRMPIKTEVNNIVNEKGEVYCTLNSLKYQHLMLIDGQGNYWFHGGGRLLVGKPVTKIFHQTSSLTPKGSVRSFVQFSDSLLWENSYSGVNVYKLPFRPDEEPFYRYPELVYGVVSVSERKGEVLTAGHFPDLMRSFPGEQPNSVVEKFTQETNPFTITTLLTTHTGSRWAGTVNNLYHFFDGGWKEALGGEMDGTEVHCMREYQDGLWIGTSSGLFQLDAHGGRILSQPEACRRFRVYEWLREGDTFWLATDQGLQRWEKHAASTEMICDLSDAMPRTNVHAVYRGADGHFILPTDFGLVAYDHTGKRRRIYKEEDGLPNDELNRFAHLQLLNGDLVMGSIYGSFFFDPDDLNAGFADSEVRYEPICVMAVFDKNDGWRSKALMKKQGREAVSIDASEVFIRIRVSNFNFIDAGTQGLFYRLKGLSDEWRQVGNGVLEFNTPNYGDYVLQIKSGNNQDDDGEMLVAFDLKVAPPFYTQWTFWMLIVGMILLMFLVFYNLRRQLWLRSQRKLEEGIAVATEELEAVNAWKSKIMATAGHDLKGPMMSLMGMGRKVKYLVDQKQWKRLDAIGMQMDGLTLQTYHTLDNLLLLGRKKKGAELPVSRIDIVELCDNQLDFVRPMANMRGVNLTFQHETVSSFHGSRYALASVVRNLLHNAISFAGTEVCLRISNAMDEDNNSIAVQITDDGPGFPPETKDAINHAQKTVAGFVSAHNSSGMGWSVIMEILLENGIGWQVKDRDRGGGTNVTLIFPSP